VPQPGWVLLGLTRLAEPAQAAYRSGRDLRFSRCQLVAPGSVELVLDSYMILRSLGDQEWGRDREHAARVAEAAGAATDPHRDGLSLVGHLIAAALDSGRLVFTSGSGALLAALNTHSWAQAVCAATRVANSALVAPDVVIRAHAAANHTALTEGWASPQREPPA
jgi:hypothetical protein